MLRNVITILFPQKSTNGECKTNMLHEPFYCGFSVCIRGPHLFSTAFAGYKVRRDYFTCLQLLIVSNILPLIEICYSTWEPDESFRDIKLRRSQRFQNILRIWLLQWHGLYSMQRSTCFNLLRRDTASTTWPPTTHKECILSKDIITL